MSTGEIVTIPSLAVASAEEVAALPALTELERSWYRGHRTYPDFTSIEEDVATGALVQVKMDDNIALVGKMRNPSLFSEFPPYLSPNANNTLKVVGRMWRDELRAEGIEMPEARLSITSLTRTEIRQKSLVDDPTKLASEDSTHTKGGAFDIDASGYYIFHENSLVPIIHPGRKGAGDIGKIVMGLVKPEERYEMPVAEVEYDQRVIIALLKVTDALHRQGLVNRIVEYKEENTFNRCLHIAARPAGLPSAA